MVNRRTEAERSTPDCRPVVAKFDQRQGSSDGGAILLRAADRRLGLTAELAQALEDERQSKKIKHELSELLTQRVMAIACGYPDTNDAARLGSDPVHKLLVGRDPPVPWTRFQCLVAWRQCSPPRTSAWPPCDRGRSRTAHPPE